MDAVYMYVGAGRPPGLPSKVNRTFGDVTNCVAD